MKRLNYKERQKRIKENIENAWNAARNTPPDPGLRNYYENVEKAKIKIICCPMEKAVNHGGILRTAEAFRLEQVDFQKEEDEAYDFTGGMGSKHWQPMRWIDAEESILAAKKEGYLIYGLTLTDEAVPIHQVEWQFPAAIVLGKEKEGLPENLVQLCDTCIAIPMYGLITSLNVSASCAITVNSAITAYTNQNPDFEPVRNISRQLIGLETIDYK